MPGRKPLGIHSVLVGMPKSGLGQFHACCELPLLRRTQRLFTAGAPFQGVRVWFLDVATVKDRSESFGVPHTEVDLILVNGQSVDFACRLQDGDRISVYPVFEAFDIAELTRLRRNRFVMHGSYSMCTSAAWPDTCECWGLTLCIRTVAPTSVWRKSRATDAGFC
jgi:Mut7-C ubiquitin